MHPFHQVEGAAHRALGIVFMGHRRSPHRHHGVPDELLDRASIALDHLSRGLEVRREQLPRRLGVARLGDRGESDQIREQDGDEAPLGNATRLRRTVRRPVRWRRGISDLRTAGAAEARSSRHGGLAHRAVRPESRAALAAEAGTRLVDRRAVGTDHGVGSIGPPCVSGQRIKRALARAIIRAG